MLATQNPIDYEGTYALPEAQLDRFLLRISVGYPDRDDEWARPRPSPATRHRRRSRSTPVIDRADAPGDAGGDRAGAGSPSASATTSSTSPRPRAATPGVELGASPRGSLADAAARRGPSAALAGRDYVTPEDVKAVAVPALSHRLTLRPELWVQGARVDQVVPECVDVGAGSGGRPAGTAEP